MTLVFPLSNFWILFEIMVNKFIWNVSAKRNLVPSWQEGWKGQWWHSLKGYYGFHNSRDEAFLLICCSNCALCDHYWSMTLQKNLYLFFDTIHLIENMRNNLLAAKKFLSHTPPLILPVRNCPFIHLLHIFHGLIRIAFTEMVWKWKLAGN